MDAVNRKSLAELLLGFFEFFGARMRVWVTGHDGGCRASTWWGKWVDAPWGPSKQYTFSIGDPFRAADNTASSVGTLNHLHATSTARYISWAVTTSAWLMREALAAADIEPAAAAAAAAAATTSSGKGDASNNSRRGSGDGSGSSSSNADDNSSKQQQQQEDEDRCEPSSEAGEILSAFCWLFGPTAAAAACSSSWPGAATANVASLGDCLAALANSSCCDPNSNSSIRDDAERVAEIDAALALFQQLLKLLGAKELDVCLGDFQQKQQVRDRLQLLEFQQPLLRQQQLQEEGALQQRFGELRIGSALSALPDWQQRQQQLQQRQQGRQQHEGGRASTGVYMQHACLEGLPIRRSGSGGSSSSGTGRSMPNPPLYRSNAPPAAGRSRAGEQQQQQQRRQGEGLRRSCGGSRSSRGDGSSGRVNAQQQQQQEQQQQQQLQEHRGGIPMSTSAPIPIAGGYITNRGFATAVAAASRNSSESTGGRRDVRSFSTEQQQLSDSWQ